MGSSTRAALAIALTAALFGAPTPAAAEPSQSETSQEVADTPSPEAPPPDIERLDAIRVTPWNEHESRTGRGLIITGATLFAASWLASVSGAIHLASHTSRETCDSGAACDQGHHGAAALMIPLAGPFMAMGVIQDPTPSIIALLALDATAQVGGIMLMLAGKQMKGESGDDEARVSIAPFPGGALARITY